MHVGKAYLFFVVLFNGIVVRLCLLAVFCDDVSLFQHFAKASV